MTLYHGTNADIELIDLTKGMRHKDFGKGFYVTPDKNTAIRMAQKKARLFGGVPTLITYELDPVALQSDLKVKVFPEKACVEWFLFVDANRDKDTINPIHDFDIVIGPIADNGLNKLFDKIDRKEASFEEIAPQLKLIKFKALQFCFKTEAAIKLLEYAKGK